MIHKVIERQEKIKKTKKMHKKLQEVIEKQEKMKYYKKMKEMH